jgi:hypothetical protein
MDSHISDNLKGLIQSHIDNIDIIYDNEITKITELQLISEIINKFILFEMRALKKTELHSMKKSQRSVIETIILDLINDNIINRFGLYLSYDVLQERYYMHYNNGTLTHNKSMMQDINVLTYTLNVDTISLQYNMYDMSKDICTFEKHDLYEIRSIINVLDTLDISELLKKSDLLNSVDFILLLDTLKTVEQLDVLRDALIVIKHCHVGDYTRQHELKIKSAIHDQFNINTDFITNNTINHLIQHIDMIKHITLLQSGKNILDISL